MKRVKTRDVGDGKVSRICPDCETTVFYPQRFCHSCGIELDWKKVKDLTSHDEWWKEQK